jgi:hypothetical protein
MFDIVDKKIWLTSLVVVALIGFVVSLIARGAINDLDLSTAGAYVTSVSAAITAATLWHLALGRWLWRWKPLRGWYVKCPDLTGNYRADLESETFGTRFSEKATIRQSVEEISYESESNDKNINKSLSSRVVVDGALLKCYLVYHGNSPNNEGQMVNHEGTIILTVLLEPDGRAPNEMTGIYFTNKRRKPETPKDRGSTGKITLFRLKPGETVVWGNAPPIPPATTESA